MTLPLGALGEWLFLLMFHQYCGERHLHTFIMDMAVAMFLTCLMVVIVYEQFILCPDWINRHL